MIKDGVIVFPGDTTGCAWYRLHNPFSIISKHIPVYWAINFAVLTFYKWNDVPLQFLATQRQYDLNQLKVYQSISYPYKMDTDDAIWIPNPGSPFKISQHQIDAHDKILKGAKKLIVSTEPLAKILQARLQFSEAPTVLPNLIASKFYKAPNINTTTSKLRVLYAGSATHYEDLKPFIPYIKSTLLKYQYVFVGWVPTELKGLVEFHSWVDAKQYLSFLPTLNCDVGLVFLNNKSRFNDYKSHIKLLEYSSLGLPVIVQHHPVYGENPNEKMTVDNFTSLLEMMQDPVKRKIWADNNYEYAQKYMLEKWEDYILKAWLE